MATAGIHGSGGWKWNRYGPHELFMHVYNCGQRMIIDSQQKQLRATQCHFFFLGEWLGLCTNTCCVAQTVNQQRINFGSSLIWLITVGTHTYFIYNYTPLFLLQHTHTELSTVVTSVQGRLALCHEWLWLLLFLVSCPNYNHLFGIS